MEHNGEFIKFEDTNIANLGSELEKQVKLAAAQTEDAWKGVGQEPGIMIWRIEKFKVVPWPKNEYGSFFSGDSYIILSTYVKDGEEGLHWNAHMWVGTFTTMDEAGTAAYKIVELDDLFNREIVLHREVQGYESELFLKYFKVITIMDGGIETGFKKVPVESYRPRLLHIRGRVDFRIAEVPLTATSLCSDDVFVLDNGLTIYSWIGNSANSYEKFKVATICQSIKSERNSKPHIVQLQDGEENDENFWKVLGGKTEIKKRPLRRGLPQNFDKQLFRISDSTGELKLTKEEFAKKSLDTNDAFLLDIGTDVFVWIGKNTSVNEKSNSISVAHKYLRMNNRPLYLPVSCMSEGRESFRLLEALGQ
jgi:gelsolin